MSGKSAVRGWNHLLPVASRRLHRLFNGTCALHAPRCVPRCVPYDPKESFAPILVAGWRQIPETHRSFQFFFCFFAFLFLFVHSKSRFARECVIHVVNFFWKVENKLEVEIIRIGIGWNSNAFMYMFLYKLLWNWKPNFIMMKLTLQIINMFNYFCLRLSHFSKNFIKGDVIGTGFFHSVLLISMGLRFCDWTSRLISILHSFHSRAKKLNYLPPYFVLFTNIRVSAWYI